MSWGAGPALGLLTFLGYLVCTAGAVYLWRYRDDFSFWIEDEVRAFRRNSSRHTVVGPFYSPREESRLRVISSQFLHSPRRIPSHGIKPAAILFFIGGVLFLLDFFI
jgi:hypothetical protein